MMHAAVIDAPGPAESIVLRRLPVPVPGPGEVLVRVQYSCVNHVDTFVRSGAHATALPAPFIIGRDLVGAVQECGPGVTGCAPGARVWSNSMGYDGRQGAFSEFCVVPVDRIFAVSNADAADLAGTAEAHRRVEQGHPRGKVLVRVTPPDAG